LHGVVFDIFVLTLPCTAVASIGRRCEPLPSSQKYSDFQNILIYRNTNQLYIFRHPAPLGRALRNVNNAARAAMAVEVALDRSAEADGKIV
jgi:hypothetical protein